MFNMTNYDDVKASFRLETPALYNFAFDVIDKRAQEADKLAYIEVDSTGENIRYYQFSDLSKRSNQFANGLLSLGAKKGDLAFVMIPRVGEWYSVMLGCCKLGVVTMPATNLLTSQDIEYRINRSKASMAIVSANNADKVEAIKKNCPSLKTLIVIGEPKEGWCTFESLTQPASTHLDRSQLAPSKASDLMMIYFTSGTTGMPKMVPRDNAYAHAHTITGKYWMDQQENDIHWTLSDTGWAKAAWGMLYSPWQMGSAMVLFDGVGFDAELHLKLIEKLGVTTFCAPPTVYRVFAQMDLSSYNLSSVRHALGAGEPLNPEVIKAWYNATGGKIYDGYGQTETINIVANYPCMPVKPGSMGKPVPGVNVQVVDEKGDICAVDCIGSIAIELTEPLQPGMFEGYWQDDEATAMCFKNGWYYTGDNCSVDKDGYFWFVGRSDDMINSSGYRISPFEVESSLLEHPAVLESAVIGKLDEARGEVVKAFIILASNYQPSDELRRDIQAFMKKQTAPYKYPREIEFVESLPKTISGKIRRIELRQNS
ncbi:MAG: AMP-binding protein [Cycloclasticus sp.]|uniref:acyl-CoA synthetase n=1 Tax=Cycloclasticus sp. TaxID=2024830 RepID=UPI00257B7DE3|nr:AMP-binding protein [Cycloclasticus sp.]MBV1898899.1 AMP-binding protein [Cycloclasticus sp.]